MKLNFTLFFVFTQLLLFSRSSWAIEFEKKTIKIKDQLINVEIADTAEKSARGLMFRTELKEGHGMLFIFEDEAPRAFWMKNTFVHLSIAYINSKKCIVDIQDMEASTSVAQKNHKTYPSAKPAMYALEVPKSWFTKKKIEVGDCFEFKAAK